MTRKNISAEAKWIEETCGIKLSHIVDIKEEGLREEVYDIDSTENNLMLVVMHHGNEEPKFIITYGMTQIPCPGMHTSEQIEDILNLQRDFPLPLSNITAEVVQSTMLHSNSFISEFIARIESNHSEEVHGRRG